MNVGFQGKNISGMCLQKDREEVRVKPNINVISFNRFNDQIFLIEKDHVSLSHVKIIEEIEKQK